MVSWERFIHDFWPKALAGMRLEKDGKEQLSSSAVFAEFVSNIRGSINALKTTDG